MTWFEIAQSFAVAFWPVWAVLAALLVVWVASRLGYMAPDEYEEPQPVQPNDRWMSAEERKYHGDDSVGR